VLRLIDKKIAIIGGTGKFGQHMGEELDGENRISISGRNVEIAREVAERYGWEYGEGKEIVKKSDVVIISVPISKTVEVIHEVGPNVPKDALLCDVTSIKKKPVEVMEQYSDEVLGMHPMYAPTNSINGQKVILCPEKGEKWSMMEEFWQERGANIHFTDPESHDQAASIVQGLIHFSELVIADVIQKSCPGKDEEANGEVNGFSTPIYQLITDLTARMLNQKPELYGSIQTENQEVEEVREMFIDSAKSLDQIVQDEEEFKQKFEELGESFNLEEAQSRTDSLIEFLSDKVRED
jgi:prephenate dehydrogenase